MLAVFSLIFVAYTKITFVYNFVAPLKYGVPKNVGTFPKKRLW